MNQIMQIFGFLKANYKTSIYMDPSDPVYDISDFKDNSEEFLEHYRDAEELKPPDMPKPRGRPVKIMAFCDASHAQNLATRRSHIGYVIFVQRAPIIWYSKRTQTVESSTFGSEFIALRTCTEHLRALRYKLRMFGVEIDGQSKIYGDQTGVVKNCSLFESTLTKKHNAIAYHAVRWAVAAKEVLVGWINSERNIADGMTKALTHGLRRSLFGSWMY